MKIEVIDILEIQQHQHLWRLLATFSLRMRSVYLGGSGKNLTSTFDSLTPISL